MNLWMQLQISSLEACQVHIFSRNANEWKHFLNQVAPGFFTLYVSPTWPLHSLVSGGTNAHFPSPELPYLGKNMPPISENGNHWFLQNKTPLPPPPPFPGFLWKIFQRQTSKKYPFLEKMGTRMQPREKITWGLRAISPPKCKKEPSKIKKRAPKNCHRLQCKSLFNVADLVNGMWKVAPENKILIFGLMQPHMESSGGGVGSPT